MTDASEAAEAAGRNSLGRTGSPLLIIARLAIGLLQGAALWWLYRSVGWTGLCNSNLPGACGPEASWPATVPELFTPLVLIAVFVPVLLLAGAGRMRLTTLAGWSVVAAAVLALLGWHEVARQSPETLRSPPFINSPMPLFAIAILFIGHHLVLGADMARKWIAPFPTYFDTAWKAGVQLALSVGFTGAFWILLFLGAALFNVIGLPFLEELLREEWFAIPVTTFVFSVAVHLTDVRDGLIRGVRTVALMLLSWLLIVITVLVAGFLIALPFTGLDGLWDTGSATALVLAAAAVLIILINTAYQDGRADNLPPLVLRWTVRIAAVLLTPLVILAFWGLALRIGQHGLTPDRIIALACAIVGAAYAVGYGWAALSPFWRKGADWMQPLERTNVFTAVLEIAVILALFSPIADPARLSVADQTARLERGAVTPDKFDYRFLRFESGQAGQAALARLTRSTNAEVARRAAAAAVLSGRWEGRDVGSPDVTPAYEIVPAGAALPEGFGGPVGASDPRSECLADNRCVVRPMDLNGDGRVEVLVAFAYRIDLWARDADGEWSNVGAWSPPHCPTPGTPRRSSPDLREAVRLGAVRPSAPPWPELSIGGAPATGLAVERVCADDRAQPPADATAAP
ncbi:DUF4153 domain-containing protein [Brevundimonas lenta]|uniref:DUF4153 domain-containing protein n=1 Tax=Brevundimonas lenta TaxID=424796 RepID=A0A7W6NQ77_9CAUL|nr:DUF4153 domain-containing protein [Brevundimonas lenta]MBB4083583.1 hypothetical protein [Brevundimonas lenta]